MRLAVILLVAPVAAALAGDWKPLFDGKDLDGWAIAEKQGTAPFVVEDGVIHTSPGKGMLWYTREKMGNATRRLPDVQR